MKSFLSKIWFPVAVMAVAASSALSVSPHSTPARHMYAVAAESPVLEPLTDTVKYPRHGYKRGWTAEELADIAKLDSATLAALKKASVIDTAGMIWARDTMKVPDSLRLTDPFRYKYYVALVDSFTHVWVRDSLRAAGDSIIWPKIDSIYYADSTAKAKAAFLAWYNSLTPRERKEYDYKMSLPKIRRQMDSVQAVKDSLQAIKDSIVKNTPRILETGYLPDTLYYKRIVAWKRDRDFHTLHTYIPDTTANYHFNDYPFMKEDQGATWLGVAGSPVQSLNWFKRTNTSDVSFYEPLSSWSYNADNIPFYNTKVPFTELCYWGTLLANDDKESDNIRIFTTQNITPELNMSLGYIRFGGGGMLENEEVKNKTSLLTLNYTGKKYLAHGGVIHNSVSSEENGGILDNMWVRDTTVEAREINVALSSASSKTSKTTFFLDQQYKIPFYFIRDRQDAKEEAVWEQFYRDSLKAAGQEVEWEALEDYLDAKWNTRELAREASGEDLTSAFIGHSSEFSKYSRLYEDKMNATAMSFYNNVTNYNPSATRDSMGVIRFDNKVFLRLQPWSATSLVSKIDAGAGNVFQRHYNFESSYLAKSGSVNWNTFYIYAGAEGQYEKYFNWNAKANYSLLGYAAGDFSLQGNMKFSLYPFRRERKSPISFNLHAETSLKEPEFYQQHFHGNHYSWDNDFSKISTTKVTGAISIPRWKLNAELGYSLLAGNIYYDDQATIRQHSGAMSIISGSVQKDFSFFNDFLHLDNRILMQYSSDQSAVPLPLLSLNLRYYIQFPIESAMVMQIGANAWYNTPWYTPGWNPNVGAFYNQTTEKYSNGPVLDAFVNIQWKKACIFIKYQNAGDGWLTDKRDFFTAHHYIGTTSGTNGLKLGIYWPFYLDAHKNLKVNASGSLGGGSSSGSEGGSSFGGGSASGGRRTASNNR